MDSVNLALNGDGMNWGFLRVIDKYGGTKAGNLANFYAGDCYIKLNENEKAIKYLKNSVPTLSLCRQGLISYWEMQTEIWENSKKHLIIIKGRSSF